MEDKKVYCCDCDHHKTELDFLGDCHHPDNIIVIQEEGWVDSSYERSWKEEILDLKEVCAEYNFENKCVNYKERKVHWFWEGWKESLLGKNIFD